VSSSAEIAVKVNGYLAFVDSGQFAVHVPLDETVTALTAEVKDSSGVSLGIHSVNISVEKPTTNQPVLTLLPFPVTGQAPLKVFFEMNSLYPISKLDFDSEGNGSIDFQGTSLKNQPFTYQVPGLYFPKVTVTDKSNNTYSRTAVVWVVPKIDLEALLQSKWTAMKNALKSGNVPEAAKYIVISRRQPFNNHSIKSF
jgi:hypothetical protein